MQQYPRENLDDISETSQIVQELLGDDFKYSPSSNSARMSDWASDEDGNLQQRGSKQVEVYLDSKSYLLNYQFCL